MPLPSAPRFHSSTRRKVFVALGALFAASWGEVTSLGRAAERDAAESPPAGAFERGRQLFSQQCASCHALAHDGIGPPLGGVTALLSRTEMAAWIRDPAAILARGGARAAALLERYKVAMPAFGELSDEDIAAIIAFIDGESTARQLTAAAIAPPAPPVDAQSLIPPVVKTRLFVELEDVCEIPRLPGRTPYKGITLLRPDPRQERALLVLDLMGLIYTVRGGEPRVFLDVREDFPEFVCEPGVATGLGSLALHPGFATNGVFYTVHAENFRGSPAINADDIPPDVPPYETPPLEWVLTEWTLADPAATAFAGTHREVLRFVTPTTGHAAQEITFAPTRDPADPDYGMLYLTCGDGGSINLKRPDLAGHPRSLLGTIMRVDPAGRDGANGRYGIPPDNPFAAAGDPAIHREIWAYGFRNPHRLSWDPTHDPRRMLAVDIGESNVEEINLVTPGGAYGWGARGLEGTMHLDVMVDAKVVRPASDAERAGTTAPLACYGRADGTAVTGGYVHTGPIELLRGKYIFGDIVNGRLFYLNVDATFSDRTIYELNVAAHGAVSSIRELARAERAHLRIGYDERTGDLFILTKDDGRVRRVTRAYEH